MVNRWSVLLLILGVTIGYLIAGTSVRAQADPLPFAVGDTITLRFGAPWSVEYNNFIECSVTDIRGTFVRCALPTVRNGRGGVQLSERWHNLQSAALVEKYQ